MRFLLSRLYLLFVLGAYVYLLFVEFQATRHGRLGAWGAVVLMTSALIGIVLVRIGSDAVVDWGNGHGWSRKTRYSLITGVVFLGIVAAALAWIARR